jgi:3',5'-cyclic AMP phosphodiesterase CpdA
VPSRILHISDLHVGSREESPIHRALAPLIERIDPELVIASGDLTHRGRRDQHEGAARFLRDLGRPLLVIPGNHDIPSWASLGRFTRTFDEFERQWQRTEPVYQSEHVLAVGLNSVRPYRHQSGALAERQLQWVRDEMARAPEGALRVVVLHHHLLGAPWRTWKPPLSRRTRVLARLVDAGAELVLAGHVHQSAVSERREFEVVHGGEHAVTVALAPGLGQPRPQRRGEARGFHVFESEPSALRVTTFVWQDDDWALIGERRFPRGREPLREIEPSVAHAAPTSTPSTPPTDDVT